jgi:threonyl-tRNA synthetase
MLVYKNSLHSYKDLPMRVGELGLVHRHEASGALNGLFRVRNFTQDDAHLYMTEDQIEGEVVRLIQFIDRIYSKFGLTYRIELSTRPLQKFIGEIEVWDRSEAALEKACRAAGKDFKLNPGDGAFYGPKLDFHIQDSLGRVWQCGTIQLDMNMPVRFDLTYIDSNGEKKRPVMLHRTIFGSVERFIGILIEHFAGAFPLWLAPVQVKLLPVNPDYHLEACEALKKRMIEEGIRVELDERNEKLGYRLREAQINKIPVQLVIGDGEIANGEVNVRRYGKNESVTMKVEDFFADLHREIKDRTL